MLFSICLSLNCFTICSDPCPIHLLHLGLLTVMPSVFIHWIFFFSEESLPLFSPFFSILWTRGAFQYPMCYITFLLCFLFIGQCESVSFEMAPSIVQYCCAFWHKKLRAYLAPTWNQSFSQGALFPFSGKWSFETKIWVLGK